MTCDIRAKDCHDVLLLNVSTDHRLVLDRWTVSGLERVFGEGCWDLHGGADGKRQEDMVRCE